MNCTSNNNINNNVHTMYISKNEKSLRWLIELHLLASTMFVLLTISFLEVLLVSAKIAPLIGKKYGIFCL